MVATTGSSIRFQNGRKNIHFSGHGFIVGTVKEKGQPDQPLVRRVQLISENTRVLVAETWSDTEATTDSNCWTRRSDTPWSATTTSRCTRAVIADNLRPEMMP